MIFKCRSNGHIAPRGRQDRGSKLPDRAEAVRGELAGAAGGGLHRARAVRRGLVSHDARVLPGVPHTEVRRYSENPIEATTNAFFT